MSTQNLNLMIKDLLVANNELNLKNEEHVTLLAELIINTLMTELSAYEKSIDIELFNLHDESVLEAELK